MDCLKHESCRVLYRTIEILDILIHKVYLMKSEFLGVSGFHVYDF